MTKTEIHPLCFLLQYGLTKTKINPFSWHLHGKCQKGLTKTKINPLRLMQVSYETWMAQPSGYS